MNRKRYMGNNMKKDSLWFASYDLDGSFEFHEVFNDYHPESYYGHLLGPFVKFSHAKEAVIHAFKDCISELEGGIKLAKQRKKNE